MSTRGFRNSGSLIALTLALAAGTAVHAADVAPSTATVGEVVVTGSLIGGTPTTAALPVDVIGAEELAKQNSPSVLELLKDLPVSSGVLGDTNQFDPRAQGSEGSGSVNLRGLGAQRTLVLINGRRMAPNPFGQAGAGIVDTNIIPVAAIGRVEVLKDGAAATYGSDAIAGVVNFITRTNFNGAEAGGTYRYVDGSKGDYTGSAIFGHTFDNGNILIALGYQHRSELRVTDRSFANKDYFSDPEGGWSGGNAVTSFIPVTQNAAGGYIPAAGFKLDAGCAPLGGVVQPGALPACLFHYTLYDNLVEEENHYQVYGEANLDFDAKTRLHVEGFYSDTDVPRGRTSPSYLALQTPTNVTDPTVGTLTPAVLAGYFVPNTNPGYIAYQAAHPGDIPAFATGAHFPGVRFRPLAEGGNPIFNNDSSLARRHYEAYRVSADLKGEFGSDFGGLAHDVGWDITTTYSQETGFSSGYDSVVDYLQLALRGYGSLGSAGTNGCTAAKTANFTTGAGNASLGCYYFNPFSNSTPKNSITGAANPEYNAALANSPDVVAGFFQKLSTKATERLFVADAVINGKLGINLPGGPVGFAAGVQFRRNSYNNVPSKNSNKDSAPCVDTPITGTTSCATRNGEFLFLGTGTNADLNDNVFATFGELQIPVTTRFDIQAAARYEDYGGRTGSTFNPKISARYQITPWLAVRGSAGSTFRGPPLTQLVPNSVTALSFIAGSFRAIDIVGNPDLKPEKANTYSAGAIFNFGRLRGTVDYWRYDFSNPIGAEPSGSIVATMFPGNSAVNCGNPAFAALQARFTFQGACGVSTIARVLTLYVNGPSVKTQGIDASFTYDAGTIFDGRLKVGASASYTIDYKTAAFQVGGVTVQAPYDAAGFLNYQLSATSLPQLKGSAYVEYTHGPHNLRVTERYIDSYGDQRTSILAPNPVNGAVLTNGTSIGKTYMTDVDYRVFLPMKVTLNLSVENLFDRDPSFARLDLNYDPFTGNALGRTFKVGLKKAF